MKKIMKLFVYVAAAAMTLASCQKNEIDNQVPQEYEYTFLIGNADTKAVIGNESVVWEDGDQMGVYTKVASGTISENLRWGKSDATIEEIKHVCKLACADEFVESFPDRYNTYIEQGGTNVSGGQKQRLCIARALLKKPKILILDDSTSAVDTATDAKIRKAFREEIPNTTKIIIAQRISSVQDADKIIVLDEGKVNDVGTHEELLARNTIYREVYTSQQKGAME
jgi:ABC-type transport system involved in cytochrome bd biosynthesis fused ATPase/permease subunit